MAEKVIMPKQGLQMTEGTITSWLIKEGGQCEKGKPLFEMETDKLTITMDAPADGTLLKIIRGEGETVPITELIAVIGKDGEDISDLLKTSMEETAGSAGEEEKQTAGSPETGKPAPACRESHAGKGIFSTPRARMRAEEKGIEIDAVQGSGPQGLVIERDVQNYVPAPSAKITPLAKKIASMKGISPDGISGTGSHGKITKNDVLMAESSASKSDAMRVAAGMEEPGRVERIPMTGMRKIIAARMTESLTDHAQAKHTVSVDMTNAQALREAYKRQDKKVSYNDIVLKAVSRALTEFPLMNASIEGEEIVTYRYVNLGVAVAVNDGLLVPNIKDAEKKNLEELGQMARELAGKAKENKLTLEEMSGGTFTVSNLGMFGLEEFVAVINSTESGILAVGAIKKTPVVVGEEILVRPIMKLTLTYDHRIVDGAPAAQFLVRIKQYIEEPMLML